MTDTYTSNIPIISFNKLLRINDRTREIEKLNEALTGEFGFFLLSLEDVDDVDGISFDEGLFEMKKMNELIENVYRYGKLFFKEREDVKMQYLHTQYETFQTGGYIPLYEEYAYREREFACLESFDTVRDSNKTDDGDDDNDNESITSSGAKGQIDWPIEVLEMKRSFTKFYDTCDDVARVLFLSFARALDLKDESVFAKNFSKDSHCAMRFMRYPSKEHVKLFSSTTTTTTKNARKKKKKKKNDEEVKEVGVSEHTDFEMFTFLHQNEKGLFVKMRGRNDGIDDGKWIAAPLLRENEAKFLVIISDGLEKFTNGRFKATLHKVERPEKNERCSIVRFNGLNANAEVYCLPEFATTTTTTKVINEDNEETHKRRKTTRKRGTTTAKTDITTTTTTTTQLDLISSKVENADKNLKDLIKKKQHPKASLSLNPIRFAQLLIIGNFEASEQKILLMKHSFGEFAGRYTGFIGKVENWFDSKVLGETCIFAACEATNVIFPSDASKRVVEKGRFRFHGWVSPQMAIEHECVLVLNELETKQLLSDCDDDDDDDRVSWFPFSDIPYAEMPEDDIHWYPQILSSTSSSASSFHSGSFTFNETSGALESYEVFRL
jgi:isopenicillin N synthase-like dioxygenase